jgi:hypothetical protein
MAFVEERLDRETAPTLRAPLLENLALTGRMGDNIEAPPHSILNWVNYLNEVLTGDPARGPAHIERFANAEIGMEPPAAYVEQFHCRPMQAVTLERIREAHGMAEPYFEEAQPAEIGNI